MKTCPHCNQDTTAIDGTAIQWCERCGTLQDANVARVPEFTATATRELKKVLMIIRDLRKLTPRETVIRESVLAIFVPDRKTVTPNQRETPNDEHQTTDRRPGPETDREPTDVPSASGQDWIEGQDPDTGHDQG